MQPEAVIHKDAGTILAVPDPFAPLSAEQENRLGAILATALVEKKVGENVLQVLPKERLLEVINETGGGFNMTEPTLEAWLSRAERDPAFQKEEYSAEDATAIVRILNATNTKHGARFRLCASRGRLDRLREYMERGVDPNTADATGRTALHVAAEMGELESIRVLAEGTGKALIIDAADKYGWTPLMAAASYGRAESVRLLLDLEANMGAKNLEGRSALHWACAKGRLNVARLLVVRPTCAKDDVDKAGWTPLHCAVFGGHAPIAKILLEAKVDEKVRDVLGRTPRDYCDDRFWQRCNS